MGIDIGPDPMEAEAAKFAIQQAAEARAKELEGTTQEQASADLEGLKKSVDNPMGLPEKPEGLEVGNPVENLPGIIDEVAKLRQGGMKREDIPDAVLREIPKEDRQAFLDRVDEIAAERKAAKIGVKVGDKVELKIQGILVPDVKVVEIDVETNVFTIQIGEKEPMSMDGNIFDVAYKQAQREKEVQAAARGSQTAK